MTIPDLFRGITAKFDEAGIPYMLTGSFASAHYGSPRSTQDIDFVIAATPAQLRQLIERLDGDHYYADLGAALEAHKRESLFNLVDLTTGWKIDLIFRKSRPFSQEEFRRRQRTSLEGVELYIATAEDVVIAKLEWARLSESQSRRCGCNTTRTTRSTRPRLPGKVDFRIRVGSTLGHCKPTCLTSTGRDWLGRHISRSQPRAI
ncbi:MAG TPA: hypothetical protein VKQ11_15230 [Candidatus Sulfotelmatobacter sp.]|nr:hypothetical protein [Candidatus Sulfotelmatobacter sp.]